MDLRDLESIYKDEMAARAKASRQHPPQEIAVPMQFPFSIRKAKSEILEVKENDWVVQQVQENSWRGRIPYPVDVWQMRKDFLSLKRSSNELLTFLNKYGWWDSVEPIPLSDVWDLQELISMALCLPPKGRGRLLSRRMVKGLPGPLSVQFIASFEYEDGKPRFVIETDGCLDALLASVQIDLARGREFRLCARPDCRQIIEISSARNKKYHDSACRSLDAMRRYRDNKRQKIARIKRRKAKVD
jgi:hypothetical protein